MKQCRVEGSEESASRELPAAAIVPRRTRQAFTALVILTCGALFGLSPAAHAEGVGAKGTVALQLGSGTSGKALGSGKVRIRAGAPAISKALSGGRVEVVPPVLGVVTGSRSTVRLGGTIEFNRGSRKVVFRQLEFVSTSDESFIRATVRGKQLKAFQLGRSANVDRQVGTVALAGRNTKLTNRAASEIKRGTKLLRLPASQIGKATVQAQSGFEDPYAATCDLPATTKVAGKVGISKVPAPITGGTVAVGDAVSWGLRGAFRNYISGLSQLDPPQGVIQGVDGGIVQPGFAPGAPPAGFTFPFRDGAWDLGDEGAGDDQVRLNGSGAILLCHKTQFRILLSNPTIAVDGFDARLIFDIDTNVLGDWIPTQKVKLADLVTSEGTFSDTEDSVTWTNVPVALTEAGSAALRLAPFSPTFRFQAGQRLDPITFTLSKANTG